MYKIAITGHRPDKLWGYDLEDIRYYNLSGKLMDIIYEKEREEEILCITGMALGVDQLYGLVALHLRDKFNLNIKVEAAIPCKNQTKMWRDKRDWQKIYNSADKITMVSNKEYTHHCMQRNEYMVNSCDLLIAVWNGISKGGTYNCIEYAKKLNKDIIHISPNLLNVKIINKKYVKEVKNMEKMSLEK